MRLFRFVISTLIVCAAASPLAANCTFSFQPQSQYAAGTRPGDVAAGDFNNDGYVDLALVNRQTSQVAILKAKADGGYLAPAYVQLTEMTQGDIVAGDLSGDGNLDLVVALMNSSNIQVLLGNGDATFAAGVKPSVWGSPNTLVMRDFNEDGKLDVAVSRSNRAGFTLLIGNGFGNLHTIDLGHDVTGPTEGGLAHGLAAGDFDDDDNLDVAVADSYNRKVFIFYGSGSGAFTRSEQIIVTTTQEGHEPRQITAGDFNGDGREDIAVVNRDPYGSANHPGVAVVLSGQNRTFGAPVMYGDLWFPDDIVNHDIDGDGDLDLLLTANDGIEVFRGNGNGTFAPEVGFGSTFAIGLVVADLNRDGSPDVATSDFTAGKATVLLNVCRRAALTISSSANPAARGTNPTISASVGGGNPAPTGTLTIRRGATILATTNLATSPNTSAILNDYELGTYELTATYSGDANYTAATRILNQVIETPPFGAPPRVNAVSFGGAVQLSWFGTNGVHHYEIWRSNGAGFVMIGTSDVTAKTDSAVPANGAYVYKVRGITSGGVASDFSPVDLAITYTFTDETLTPGTTPVKAAHLSELRTAADAVRAVAGIGAASWTTSSVARATQITELRTAVNTARTALGMAAASFTDPSLSPGSPIRATHFGELRASMR